MAALKSREAIVPTTATAHNATRLKEKVDFVEVILDVRCVRLGRSGVVGGGGCRTVLVSLLVLSLFHCVSCFVLVVSCRVLVVTCLVLS